MEIILTHTDFHVQIWGFIFAPFIFDVVMDVVTEEMAKEGHALMYADDLVL